MQLQKLASVASAWGKAGSGGWLYKLLFCGSLPGDVVVALMPHPVPYAPSGLPDVGQLCCVPSLCMVMLPSPQVSGSPSWRILCV